MLKIYRNDLFLKSGLLPLEVCEEIEKMRKTMDKSFLKTALNYAFLSRLDYKNLLLKKGISFYQFDYANLTKLNREVSKADLDFLLDHNLYPLQSESGEIELVSADPSDDISISKFRERFSLRASHVHFAEDLDIVKALHLTYGESLLQKAVFDLYNRDSKSSALETFTSKQIIVLCVLGLIFLILLLIFPVISIITVSLLINLFFFISIGFKFMLTIVGAKSENLQKVSKSELGNYLDSELPYYTLQLPVFKESEVIYKLASNLKNIDYPKEKLDVKLLIESDDPVTFDAVKNLKDPCIFDPVIVPYAQPKTKPKACNYGLYFSKGKYLAIYDAEDIPDSDQLKLVNALFHKLPEEYIVIQCALNYFNKTENFLTRMFTLEYSYWFDYMLPGLDGLDIPIPLGGTSNHFKFDKLIELGGWDGFNVTEDADLGIRAYAKGYKVSVLDSTTYEEANNEFYNWIRQRSRWIKGYMQTYLVHMRNPAKLYKEVGWNGFFGFQFFIGGTIFTFLIYPILLFTFLFYLFLKLEIGVDLLGSVNQDLINFIKLIFPDWLIIVSIFNFLAGNLLMIFVNMIAVFRRKSYNLILYAIANPVYWIMHSISAYKGLFQLISKPFYWEKTNHGLTKADKSKI
ncbi:glycosyltransferase [Psychroflexus sp. YR1-1]|uniref:Glycosyltransferase n=1 Tax=Psychroflexus aurantiacus TaxID=2709310 RepID=A0A6B3R4P8_9FLAO|nr:glycosyltransferase family 2 protein [Psychroflexus aurantiacus]NEV94530.1 glycosyltransferase [Psychroflexus aurantiacus]